jgi:hypothetical protein
VITGYEVKGADRFAATLDEAARKLGDLSEAGAEAGRIVSDLAAATAPRLTGALASSVGPEVVGNVVTIGSDLVYALPIHNGWAAHNIAPHPFLDDAVRRSQDEWVGVYEKATEAALDTVEGV